MFKQGLLRLDLDVGSVSPMVLCCEGSLMVLFGRSVLVVSPELYILGGKGSGYIEPAALGDETRKFMYIESIPMERIPDSQSC